MTYPAVRIPAVKAPSATVIFLHGLGDSGNGWRFLAEEAIRKKRLQHVNFIFPDAPMKPVTLNFGMQMPAWYDIPKLENVRHKQDEVGVLESVDRLKAMIEEELGKGVPSERVVIGGFSQGCAISYGVCLNSEE
ncbi:palmitoyl-(protein) hydrolase [Sugiyamaella lignohabitans]|uniref:Acyl-protein thioesterase 1 n=1 Tax=Sugiyamaella lignohabitans TaxID=796027 RepID=A0A167FJ02_9ASCO|nr:palmitoyl-(protein) hydrolase [Sugiyamaella lignohabitans]ANB15364.1 palmitoyl-(protein) hydrolase [Sugiyamaella lignohabitans]